MLIREERREGERGGRERRERWRRGHEREAGGGRLRVKATEPRK
jgi:hypothetical protein